jgi:AraC-like DNA-binding protein
MENISVILFSQYTFERLAPAVLTLVIFVFLMARRGKDRSQLYLSLYFAFAFLYEAGHLVTYSVYSPIGAYGWYMTAAAPFGLVFLLQFAYCFSSGAFAREAKIVFYLTMTLSVLAVGEYFIRASGAAVIFTETGYAPDYVSRSIPVLCFLLYAWMIVVYLRNILHDRDRALSAFAIMLRPDTASGRISRNLAVLVFFDLVKTAMILFHVLFASLPYVTVVSIQNALFLIIYAMYAVVFIRDDLPRLSLSFKIVGSIFIINLLVFSTTGQAAMSQFEDAYDEKRLGEMKYIVKNFGADDFTSMPDDIDFALRLEPEGYHRIFSRGPAAGIDNKIMLSDFTPGRWRFSTGEQGITPEKALTMKRYFARMSDTNYNLYIIEAEEKKFVIGYNFRGYRTAASSPAGVLVLISLLTTAFILFGLPPVMTRLLARNSSVPVPADSGTPSGKTSPPDEEAEDREYAVTAEARQKVERAVKYISQNYMNELTREGLADIAGLSPGRFGRAFRTCTGRKVGEYVNDLRIEKARELLGGDDAVINIAYSTGFESLSTFSRAFHKNCGMTPTAYRETLRKA